MALDESFTIIVPPPWDATRLPKLLMEQFDRKRESFTASFPKDTEIAVGTIQRAFSRVLMETVPAIVYQGLYEEDTEAWEKTYGSVGPQNPLWQDSITAWDQQHASRWCRIQAMPEERRLDLFQRGLHPTCLQTTATFKVPTLNALSAMFGFRLSEAISGTLPYDDKIEDGKLGEQPYKNRFVYRAGVYQPGAVNNDTVAASGIGMREEPPRVHRR